MNAKEVLNKLKEKLSLSDEKVEVKFETQMLEGGEVSIEAESFEAGNEVFVIAEEDRIPLPVGEYVLEDGRALVIEEEGVIASIGEAQAEEVEEEVVEEEQEMTEENSTPKKVVESVSKEIHFSDEQKDELKNMFKEWFEEFSKTEKEEVKEEVELSEVPTAKPIKHSPDSDKQKRANILLGKNGKMTVVDKILAKQLSRTINK